HHPEHPHHRERDIVYSRWLLGLFLCCMATFASAQTQRSDPINTVPNTPWSASGQAQVKTWQLYEDAALRLRMQSPFIYSGGKHATSGTLVSASFATEAFVPERVAQSATAITYAAIANDTCWTILSSQNTAITGWTRVGTTAYYYQCEGDTTPNQ